MPELPVLIAPDSFKGTIDATDVAAAINRGLQRAGLIPGVECPVADGGEGTASVLISALGGSWHAADAHDPLGRPIGASFALLRDGSTAVVEVAEATGISLLKPSERNPLIADSRGTGELIAAAVASGAREVLIACGGSATVDGGVGAIETLKEVDLSGVKLSCLCDSRVTWERAATVFGPQKGAGPDEVALLEERLETLSSTKLKKDPRGVTFSGGAGGIAGGLWSEFGASLSSGSRRVIEELEISQLLKQSRALIVGEGQVDRTTLSGKIAGELAVDARQVGVPAFAICGSNAIDPFDQRILDLQVIMTATDVAEIETAAEQLAAYL